MNSNLTFGETVRRTRVGLRLSQRTVGEACGIRQSRISFIENGLQPSIAEAVKIADYLHLSREVLLRKAGYDPAAVPQ